MGASAKPPYNFAKFATGYDLKRDRSTDLLHFMACGLPIEEAEFAANSIQRWMENQWYSEMLVWNLRVQQVQVRAAPIQPWMIVLWDLKKGGLQNVQIPSLT